MVGQPTRPANAAPPFRCKPEGGQTRCWSTVFCSGHPPWSSVDYCERVSSGPRGPRPETTRGAYPRSGHVGGPGGHQVREGQGELLLGGSGPRSLAQFIHKHWDTYINRLFEIDCIKNPYNERDAGKCLFVETGFGTFPIIIRGGQIFHISFLNDYRKGLDEAMLKTVQDCTVAVLPLPRGFQQLHSCQEKGHLDGEDCGVLYLGEAIFLTLRFVCKKVICSTPLLWPHNNTLPSCQSPTGFYTAGFLNHQRYSKYDKSTQKFDVLRYIPWDLSEVDHLTIIARGTLTPHGGPRTDLCKMESFQGPTTRWAPTSYQQGLNSSFRGYNPSYPIIRLFRGYSSMYNYCSRGPTLYRCPKINLKINGFPWSYNSCHNPYNERFFGAKSEGLNPCTNL